ncbi:MAG TPA: dihydroneopterin aldolase [Opitutales bacterium]|jgi:dihydroneopterin aldolase|nr:dihydroneopterin aldolase [Opitutales bacterium]
MDTLTLHRLRFFAHHGVLPTETARGQIFEITVRLELPLAEAGRADDLAHTVDYQAAYDVVRKVMEGPRRQLAEALAENIAADLLHAFAQVTAVDIEVIKPQPPVGFAFAGFSAQIRRTRP